MTNTELQEEIRLCSSLLQKFKEDLADCKKDYDALKKLEEQDKDKPEFKKAFLAVKERNGDLTASIKLLNWRLEQLQKGNE